MRFVPRALTALGAASAVLFFAGLVVDDLALRLATKPWPVVAMAAWVGARAPKGRYRAALLAGLSASLVGDMLLETSPRTLFVPGLLAFLVAHVLYVVAYRSDARSPALPRAAVAYAYGLGVMLALRPGLGPLAGPVVMYTGVICTMLWRAAARVGAAGVPAASARLALAGAVVFGASDSLIALARFGGHLIDEAVRGSVGWRLAIMVTYWAGQWAIAASAVALSPREASATDAPAARGMTT